MLRKITLILIFILSAKTAHAAGMYFYGGQSQTGFTAGDNGHHHVEMTVTILEKPTQLSAPNHLYVILPFARGLSLTTQFTETILGVTTTCGTQGASYARVASTEFPFANCVKGTDGKSVKIPIGATVKMTADKWDGETNVYSAWYVQAVNGAFILVASRIQYVGPYYHFPGESTRLKQPDAKHPNVAIQPWVTGGGIHPAQGELYRDQGNCKTPILVDLGGVSIFPQDTNAFLYSDSCLHTTGTLQDFTVSTD